MPHDRNGAVLTAGDQVMIPCTVKEVMADGQFCNLTLTTNEPMPGNVSDGCDGKSSIVLNAKQVVKSLVVLLLLLIVPAVASACDRPRLFGRHRTAVVVAAPCSAAVIRQSVTLTAQPAPAGFAPTWQPAVSPPPPRQMPSLARPFGGDFTPAATCGPGGCR